METVSFVLAVGSLPGVFTSCVECYNYLQASVQFEKDFESALCKLEASKLRLNRWGAAVDIEGSDPEIWQHYDEKGVQAAYRWLNGIRESSEAAIQITSYYTKPAHHKTSSIDDTQVPTAISRGFRTWMERFNTKCAKPRRRDRCSWALHHKERLKELIDDISNMTLNLVELFPSPSGPTEQLHPRHDLHTRIASSGNGGSGEDKVPYPGPRDLRPQDFHLFSNIEVRDEVRGHFGDNIAPGEKSNGGVYSSIVASGQAVVHFGNNVGSF